MGKLRFILIIITVIFLIIGLVIYQSYPDMTSIGMSRKADEQRAKIIEKALNQLFSDIDNTEVTTLYDVKGNPIIFGQNDPELVKNLIVNLQETIYDHEKSKTFGPYLVNPDTTKKAIYETYATRFSPDRGGTNVGYQIEISKKGKESEVKCRVVRRIEDSVIIIHN